MTSPSAQLVSLNVGLPREIDWQGRTVRTAIWKEPVVGRRLVRRLNIDGDGQGDLVGHGGEHRAVFVYQVDSYRYWQQRLDRNDFVWGQFGENFTIDGLSDDQVCIGDRFQIGEAIFEVSQPRVTCYRVGIRTNEPQMALLLTSSGRPGFYLRVLQEGTVGAGDSILPIAKGPEGMTVKQVNALLYSPRRPPDDVARASRILALSPGWRASFEALLAHANEPGNAGLVPSEAARRQNAGFSSLVIDEIQRESADVISLVLRARDGSDAPLPGQFVVLRLASAPPLPTLYRSYSLSSNPSALRSRISVKIEPHGAAGARLSQMRAGDRLDVSAPRGTFLLEPGLGAVVLLSAGIGITPLLAMLHALSSSHSSRPVFWIHGARDGEHHPFARESTTLLATLAHGHRHIMYSRPRAEDHLARDYDGAGHISAQLIDDLAIPKDADFYLCGPSKFMQDLRAELGQRGVSPAKIHLETFGGVEASTPGVASERAPRAPHRPDHEPSSGPIVSFARSGLDVRWDVSLHPSVLELAEACDVPVRWSCRTGVCHTCESGLVSGAVWYRPEPLDAPARGNVLICCARPCDDIVVDI